MSKVISAVMPKVRKTYSVEKKLEVITWYKENGSNFHKTSKEFSIDRKTLRDWVRKENELRGSSFDEVGDQKKLGSGRQPLSDILDEDLFNFFDNEQKCGRDVTNKLLLEQASVIADRLGLTDFKSSDRYIANWKRRYGITVKFNDSMEKKCDNQEASGEMQEENNFGAILTLVKKLQEENDMCSSLDT